MRGKKGTGQGKNELARDGKSRSTSGAAAGMAAAMIHIFFFFRPSSLGGGGAEGVRLAKSNVGTSTSVHGHPAQGPR
jgi:hypothetical protein